MRPIPPKLRKELEADPFYKRCCITGSISEKIDWHHNFIFAGKQVNEKWCILPLANSVHEKIVYYKKKCDLIMLLRADDDTLRRYSKAIDLIKYRGRLIKESTNGTLQPVQLNDIIRTQKQMARTPNIKRNKLIKSLIKQGKLSHQAIARAVGIKTRSTISWISKHGKTEQTDWG